MKCRPHDLARIVQARNPANIDRFVTVLPCGRDGELGWEWLIQASSPLQVLFTDDKGGEHVFNDHRSFCPDAWLEPIRDHGADAIDEMLQIAGAPAEVAA